jgi:citrate synthase
MNGPPDLLTAAEAAELLGVKLSTLYSYVSRGRLRRVRGSGRASRFERTEVERLHTRQQARAGHAGAAASAMRWGPPVIDSAISELTERGPAYRGHLAVDLAARAVPLATVAELLWTGRWPGDAEGGAAATDWLATPPEGEAAGLGLAATAPSEHPLVALQQALPAFAARDATRFGSSEPAERERARRLLRFVRHALLPDDALFRTLEPAAVLLADHELNASTFAARVVASTGADLYSAVLAGVCALFGPLHGGACDRIEALFAEARGRATPASVVAERARRGEGVPGFGHPVYPGGDPRAALLWDRAEALASGDSDAAERLRAPLAIAEAMYTAGHGRPTVDFALVALCDALGAPPGTAIATFAAGRCAGWIAHALEQREQGYLLRPRAQFIG